MMKLKLFYIWLLPTIWVSITVGSFFNTGDEHGCFWLSIRFFMWLSFLVDLPYNSTEFLLFLIPTGIIIIALSGLLMDRLRASWKIMVGFSVAGFIASFIFLVIGFESLQDLSYKHGSVLAPLFTAANVGLYSGILFSLIISLSYKLANKKYGTSMT